MIYLGEVPKRLLKLSMAHYFTSKKDFSFSQDTIKTKNDIKSAFILTLLRVILNIKLYKIIILSIMLKKKRKKKKIAL